MTNERIKFILKPTGNCFLFCNHGQTQSEASVNRLNLADLENKLSYNLITAQPGVLFMAQRHKCVTK